MTFQKYYNLNAPFRANDEHPKRKKRKDSFIYFRLWTEVGAAVFWLWLNLCWRYLQKVGFHPIKSVIIIQEGNAD